jgi:phenylalanyl-tRNA synthetase beta chain
MKLPISWLKDFVDLKGLAVEEIARILTLAGLEVGEIAYAGLEMAAQGEGQPHEFKIRGLAWTARRSSWGSRGAAASHRPAHAAGPFRRQAAHRADQRAEHLPSQGHGKLLPLKVAYAKEGAALYDGHAAGQQLMTLKRTKIRGVDSYSMACSEKELGISDEHEGIILLDADAPVGMPLADFMGDAVLDIDLPPNMARNVNVLGVARELAALTGRKLIQPRIKYKTRRLGEAAGLDQIRAEAQPRVSWRA